mgnify:FL=1
MSDTIRTEDSRYYLEGDMDRDLQEYRRLADDRCDREYEARCAQQDLVSDRMDEADQEDDFYTGGYDPAEEQLEAVS